MDGILAIIEKCFLSINAEILETLYKTFVRPPRHLEFANQSGEPYLEKHILMLESVQRRATRLVPGIGSEETYIDVRKCPEASNQTRTRHW